VRVDELLEQGRRTADKDKRLEIYKEFQNQFVEDLPSIPIYYRLYTYAIDRKVRDVKQNLIFEVSDRFAGVSDWYLKSKRVLRTEGGAVRADRN
jgi:peptide/nickel transport system substrate-binding protein